MSRLFAAEAFVMVVDEGSFTAAARRLGVTKSYASRVVTGLEERLGVRLLHRSTRKLALTEPGQAYYERCTEVIRTMEEAELAATQLQSTPRGHLRVTLPMALGVGNLLLPLTEFVRRYPEVTLETFFNDRRVDLIAEGFDAAVRVGEVRDTSLISRRVATAPRLLCASAEYLAQRGRPKEPEDLTKHSCLLYAYHNSPAVWRMQGPRGDVAVPVSGRVISNHASLLVEAAKAGHGVVFAPVIFTAEALRKGELQQILPDWMGLASIHVLYPRQNPPLKVRLFVDLMVAYFQSPPWAEFCQERRATS